MLKENAIGDDAPGPLAGLPDAGILAGRSACGLGSALLLLLAGAEAAHWQAATQTTRFEQVVQQAVPISSPSSHPDVSAPDPGDTP